MGESEVEGLQRALDVQNGELERAMEANERLGKFIEELEGRLTLQTDHITDLHKIMKGILALADM